MATTKAFMSTGSDEAQRYYVRGVESTRACWALDEATRILAETEPAHCYPGTSFRVLDFWKHVPVGDLGKGGQFQGALAEALAAFVEGGI